MFDDSRIIEYKKHLNKVRRAANTIASYMRDITKFADYLESCGKSDFDCATNSDVKGFVSRLESIGRSPSTIARCIASVRAFFNHMMADGTIRDNPTIEISTTCTGKKTPPVLSGEEIERLLAQPDANTPKGSRDKAMLDTLYATGLRVSELIGLDESDVNLATGLIKCRNGNERTIPVYPAAIASLSRYIGYGRREMAKTGETALFVNISGGRMTRQGFWKILKHYSDEACIEICITPQVFRNSFAAHLLENGADIRSLQELLGHSDISSTRIYARAIKTRLKDVYNRTHPKA